MKEHPILFSGPMVRAILAGHKTQTRRLAKPGGLGLFDGRWTDSYVRDPGNRSWLLQSFKFGPPGDRLWVKETFCPVLDAYDITKRAPTIYRASHTGDAYEGCWKPSIFMPRKESRILLERTEPERIERLWDITDDDARQEGVYTWAMENLSEKQMETLSRVDAYVMLWESINGPGSWQKNPWVQVVSFKVVQP